MNTHQVKNWLDTDVVYKIRTAVIQRLFRPYATVYFCYSPFVGFWFALLSWCSPRTACAGLLSLVCTLIWGKLLSIKPAGDLHLVNGLLCGLFLSAYYPLSPSLITALIIITLFITISVNWLSSFMWYMGKIPLLTLPFVLGTWLVTLVFQETNMISLPPIIFLNENLPELISWKWTNDFFCALGGLMLVPYPLTGALMFLGILITSRYLAFLAVAGYIVGAVTLFFLDYHFLEVKSGYNFMLVTMALGGIFMVPSRISFLIALGGSVLTGLFVVALFKALDPFQLPVLIMPFLLSTYFWLGGLGSRIDKNRGLLNLDFPVSPEITWENERLNKARGINIDSTPIIKLFEGEWLVDRDSKTQRVYFSKKVTTPEVDQPVLSPAAAQVLSVRYKEEEIPYSPTQIILDKEWGNFLLMRDRLGQYIFLPHLKIGSIQPKINEWVKMGQHVAASGKSADNSEYCLYLQIQKGILPTSDQIPFHLVNVLSYADNKQPRQFHLFYFPIKGNYVIEATRDATLFGLYMYPYNQGLDENVVTDNHKRKYERLTDWNYPTGPNSCLCSSEIVR